MLIALSDLEQLDQGWRTNGTRAMDATRQDVLGILQYFNISSPALHHFQR